MRFCPQNGQVRQRFAQNALQNGADGVFCLKMARVDEIEPAVFCLFKVIIFEVSGHERIAARCQHVVNRAAAASAADSHTPHGFPRVRKPAANSARRCSRTMPVRMRP